jgi:uncharacterized membrane protein
MKTSITLGLLFLFAFTPAFAQELYQDQTELLRGKVTEVVEEEIQKIPGTDTTHLFQTIRIEVISGSLKGEVIVLENDYLKLERGDKFYFNRVTDINGGENFVILNVDRKDSLIFLVIIFIVAVILFGGWQGARSLLALLGSFLAIFYILMPGILNGWNPIVASFLVAGGILFAAIFFTHGFNRESAVAYGGTMIAVLLTSLFAIYSVGITKLSGFGTDETVYLNFTTSGSLDFVGLLLGAMIIGILGVLDDIAVTQAAVVSELYDSNPNLTWQEVYKKGIRVGKEHVSALVNTLVLAYTGVALPLLLYFYLSPAGFAPILNMEIISTEIVRIIVGSVGLIMTVPIVTILAAFYLKGYKSKHAHSHSHIHHH